MANVPYSALMPDVLILVEGVPQAIANHAICNAAIELCEESLIHRSAITMLGADVSSGSVQILPPAGSRVVRIMGVTAGGRVLSPTNTDELDRSFSQTSWRGMLGDPTHYFCPTHDAAALFPAPDIAIDIVADVVLAPSMESVGYDEQIMSRFRQGIADGAVSRLMTIPNKPWSNLQQAALHARLFAAVKADARVAANMSNSRDTLRVEFPRA